MRRGIREAGKGIRYTRYGARDMGRGYGTGHRLEDMGQDI